MKRYVAVYILVTVLVLAGFLLLTRIQTNFSDREIDTVAVNEITKRAASCWDDFKALDQMDFMYNFTVIDDEGKLVYASVEGLPDSEISSIRRGFLPMSITADGRLLGTALIETSPAADIIKAYSRLSAATVIAFLLLCALNAASLTVIYRAVVLPFRRIEQFSRKISAGVFDEPLPMSKNYLSGLFTQSFDIMRDSLLEARMKQQAAERAQKELVATLSHDIKTPVTSIKLVSELLQVSSTDPSLTEKLKTIESKANQIDRLMNDMLYSALEELGELHVTPTSEASSVLIGLFKNADHLSKVRLGKMPSCLIELDRARAEQVLGNIIANSYKYAGTDIDVDFSINGDGLQVDINDYGKGVNPDELELITAKFYRGGNAKALQKEGEGLGLYVAKQLMIKMGGGLEALSRSDGFTIRLWVRLS